MDIASAKQQIENTVQIYLQKDALGRYRMPLVHQRPVFLLGAPGLGKTAIMQQIADEMGLGLVSYSMTHHTRQSAVGLPKIAERDYCGQHFSVTEYTMSEIILRKFNTTFGEVIIVSPDKEYKVGDIISTNEEEFCIRQIIPQTRPKEELQVSFVASQVNNTRIL